MKSDIENMMKIFFNWSETIIRYRKQTFDLRELTLSNRYLSSAKILSFANGNVLFNAYVYMLEDILNTLYKTSES